MGKTFLILLLFVNNSFSDEWMTPQEGRENHSKYIKLYQGLFADYQKLSKDSDEDKKKNQELIKDILKAYECRLTSMQFAELQKKSLNFLSTKDPFLKSQIAFLLTAYEPTVVNARKALKLMEEAAKEEHPYGAYVDFLIGKYKSMAVFHVYDFKGAKAWKDACTQYINAYAAFAQKKPIKDFDHLYIFELDNLYCWETSNHYNYARKKINETVKDPWLNKLGEAVYLEQDSKKNRDTLIKLAQEIHELNPKNPRGAAIVFYSTNDKEEKDKWLKISQSITPDYVKSQVRYFYRNFGDRVELLKKMATQNNGISALDESTLEMFYDHVKFSMRYNSEGYEKFSSDYKEVFHPLAKKLEQRIAAGEQGTGNFSNNVHTLHYKMAKILNYYSHIRKIHELYGDIVKLDKNDEGKFVPFCYAITGNAGKVVKTIDEKFEKIRETLLTDDVLSEWKNLLKDVNFAEENTSEKEAAGYFLYLRTNCQTAIDYLEGKKVNLVFDKNYSLYYRSYWGAFEREGDTKVSVISSMQNKFYMRTLLKFGPPYTVNGTVKLLNKSAKSISGIGCGNIIKKPNDGRMFFVRGSSTIGYGRPATYGGEFREFKKSILVQKFDKSKPFEMILTVKAWNGAAVYIGDGNTIETYIDDTFKPGAVVLGPPIWFAIGGYAEFSNISIQKLDEKKPEKGYVPKYDLFKPKK